MKHLLLTTLLILSFNAWSVDSDFYITAQGGRADINIGEEFLDYNANSYNEDGLSLNAAFGFRPFKHLSVELGAYNVGALDFFENDRIEFKGQYLALVGSINISEDWFLSGKVGKMKWGATANPHNTSQDETGEGRTEMFCFGFGWAFHRHWQLVVNHLITDADGIEINAASVGVSFVF